MEEFERIQELEAAYYDTEAEYNEQAYECDELGMAIQVVSEFCEESEHREIILRELAAYKDCADEKLIRLKNKRDVADRFCREAEIASLQ